MIRTWPESRNALVAQGLDPDHLNYEGTEIEKTVTNADTLRKQWDEFMNVCVKDESGQLPGKSIVFAMTQAHAERQRALSRSDLYESPPLIRLGQDAVDRFFTPRQITELLDWTSGLALAA